jgi:phosphatidylglycerophosphate synthase
MPEKILTTPNLLTLSRIPMAAAVWIDPRSGALVIPLMVAAALSDVLDGRFARHVRASRERRGEDPGVVAGAKGIGAWLDPLCDKIFVLSLLGAVYVANRPGLEVVALIATRELFLVPMAVIYRASKTLRARTDFDFRAGIPGKLATVSQFAAVAIIVVAPELTFYFALAAGALGALATFAYMRRFLRAYRSAS